MVADPRDKANEATIGFWNVFQSRKRKHEGDILSECRLTACSLRRLHPCFLKEGFERFQGLAWFCSNLVLQLLMDRKNGFKSGEFVRHLRPSNSENRRRRRQLQFSQHGTMPGLVEISSGACWSLTSNLLKNFSLVDPGVDLDRFFHENSMRSTLASAVSTVKTTTFFESCVLEWNSFFWGFAAVDRSSPVAHYYSASCKQPLQWKSFHRSRSLADVTPSQLIQQIVCIQQPVELCFVL